MRRSIYFREKNVKTRDHLDATDADGILLLLLLLLLLIIIIIIYILTFVLLKCTVIVDL